MPEERRRFRLGGLQLGEQDQVVEREHERWVAHLAERDLGREEVALLDGAGEPSAGAPLTGHLPKGPALPSLRSLDPGLTPKYDRPSANASGMRRSVSVEDWEDVMSVIYRILYQVGLTPWEGSAEQAGARDQISAMFDREEDG